MRRGFALAPLVAVLMAVVEIAVFVAVTHVVGAGWAVLLLLLSSAVGLWLLRREGTRAWRRFRVAAQGGTPPGAQVSDGLVGLLGALLLALPGFVTAVLGLALVVPPTRWLARDALGRAAVRRVSSAVAGEWFGPRRVRVHRGAALPDDRVAPSDPAASAPTASADGEVVEGEIVEAVRAPRG